MPFAGYLGVREHPVNHFRIRCADQSVLIQFSFSLGGFLGQNMAGMRMPPFDFPGRRDLESLGSALMCLLFQHKKISFGVIKKITSLNPNFTGKSCSIL